jgi:hypothetical protein
MEDLEDSDEAFFREYDRLLEKKEESSNSVSSESVYYESDLGATFIQGQGSYYYPKALSDSEYNTRDDATYLAHLSNAYGVAKEKAGNIIESVVEKTGNFTTYISNLSSSGEWKYYQWKEGQSNQQTNEDGTKELEIVEQDLTKSRTGFGLLGDNLTDTIKPEDAQKSYQIDWNDPAHYES